MRYLFITKWSKHCYKVGWLCVITMWQEKLKNGTVNFLQMGQSLLQWGHVLKKGSFIAKWGRQNGISAITKWGWQFIIKWVNRYCKVGWVLLSGVSTLQREGNYYKKGQYTFMTLGQVKTHVCLLIRPMRLESGVL